MCSHACMLKGKRALQHLPILLLSNHGSFLSVIYTRVCKYTWTINLTNFKCRLISWPSLTYLSSLTATGKNQTPLGIRYLQQLGGLNPKSGSILLRSSPGNSYSHKQSIILLTAPAYYQNNLIFSTACTSVCSVVCPGFGATEGCSNFQSSQFQDKKKTEKHHGMKVHFPHKDAICTFIKVTS